jgi:FkbM family methyltransferase
LVIRILLPHRVCCGRTQQVHPAQQASRWRPRASASSTPSSRSKEGAGVSMMLHPFIRSRLRVVKQFGLRARVRLRGVAVLATKTGLREALWRRQSTPFVFVRSKERFVVRADDSVIGRELFVFGEFDFKKFALALDLLGKKQLGLLVDVGANVGSICIPAVVRGLADRAIAFEPEPINFVLLETNCKWNGVHHFIDLHQVALSDGNGSVTLNYPSPTNHGDVRISLDSHDGPTIQSRVFDDMDIAIDADSDLVWMDVQGHELSVLRGMPTVLAARVPLVLEFWPHELKKTGSVDMLLGMLDGYERFIDLAKPDAGWQALRRLSQEWTSREHSENRFTDFLVC